MADEIVTTPMVIDPEKVKSLEDLTQIVCGLGITLHIPSKGFNPHEKLIKYLKPLG
jgi:hypothetical protein